MSSLTKNGSNYWRCDPSPREDGARLPMQKNHSLEENSLRVRSFVAE